MAPMTQIVDATLDRTAFDAVVLDAFWTGDE